MKIEEASEEPTLPWQHVASFALHKLFSAWDEGGDITERLVTNVTTTADGTPVVPEKKPAKKMPPNPETMNPIMLLNQMVPHAQYVELSKAGNPPSIVFTYKCSANGQSFIGRGEERGWRMACKVSGWGRFLISFLFNLHFARVNELHLWFSILQICGMGYMNAYSLLYVMKFLKVCRKTDTSAFDFQVVTRNEQKRCVHLKLVAHC